MKTYYRDETKIIVFTHVAGMNEQPGATGCWCVWTVERDGDPWILRDADGERFIAEFTAWLDAQEVVANNATTENSDRGDEE
jgi:predicted RNase H-related nuclease YkuK (DUF458 family)